MVVSVTQRLTTLGDITSNEDRRRRVGWLVRDSSMLLFHQTHAFLPLSDLHIKNRYLHSPACKSDGQRSPCTNSSIPRTTACPLICNGKHRYDSREPRSRRLVDSPEHTNNSSLISTKESADRFIEEASPTRP